MGTLEWVVVCVVVAVLAFAAGAEWQSRHTARLRRVLEEIRLARGTRSGFTDRFVDESESAYLRRLGQYRGGPS